MFGIGWTEFLVIAVMALVVIGPKDMPHLLYKLGKLVRKIKGFTHGVQSSLEEVTRQAEVDEIANDINNTVGGPDLQFEIDRQVEKERAKDDVI